MQHKKIKEKWCGSNKLWWQKKKINQTQLGNALGHSNVASRTQYYSSEFKRERYEIQDCDDYQPFRMFLKEELAVAISSWI